jgi:Ca2+-binding EF-hand superfamily protein
MASKKFWIVAGLIVAGAGATAVAAQGYLQKVHGRDGYHGGYSGYHGERGRGWGDSGPITKEDFDGRTRERFARMDVNGDGVIDADEARAMIEQRMERRGRRWRERGGRFAQRMIRQFDADRDGKVTKAEFEGRIGEVFARFDLDSDGKITDADLPPFMRGRDVLSGDGHFGRRGHGGRHGRRFMRMLHGADANGDGAVTLEEAQAAAAKRFARWDRNADGAIDQSDRDALQGEMMDYRLKRFMHRFGAKDGKVTREQFTKFRDERFARLDHDGDNTLTGDELPRGRWGMGKHRGGWHHGGGRHGWHHDGPHGGRGGPGSDEWRRDGGGGSGPGGRGGDEGRL